MSNPIVKTVYALVRFVATWLQQPTVIEVAAGIEVHSVATAHEVIPVAADRT